MSPHFLASSRAPIIACNDVKLSSPVICHCKPSRYRTSSTCMHVHDHACIDMHLHAHARLPRNDTHAIPQVSKLTPKPSHQLSPRPRRSPPHCGLDYHHPVPKFPHIEVPKGIVPKFGARAPETIVPKVTVSKRSVLKLSLGSHCLDKCPESECPES